MLTGRNRSGSAEAVRLLLDVGVSVNTKEPFSWTPLHEAVTESNAEVVEVLWLCCCHGSCPRDYACACTYICTCACT